MSKEKLFQEIIAEMAKDGNIKPSEYAILLEKGKSLGIGQSTLDLLIKMELAGQESIRLDKERFIQGDASAEFKTEYTFKSAITRGGSILTPDIITVSQYKVSYKKRNKNFINVDTICIPISKISSVEIDSSILGTKLIIKSFGAGKIEANKFTKSDSLKIKKLILERQK